MLDLVARRPRATPEVPFAGVVWGEVGWRPLGTLLPPNQIGAWGEAILSQYPARWEGVQLFGGVAGLQPRWTVPTRSLLPIWQQTQVPSGPSTQGGQRRGQSYSAGQGPIALARQRMAQLQAQAGATGLQNSTAMALIRQANFMPGASS